MQVNAHDITRAPVSFPTNDRSYWFANETGCAHAYNIKKWRPSQQTVAGQSGNSFFDCSEFEAIKSLVVGLLHAVMSINFGLKSR